MNWDLLINAVALLLMIWCSYKVKKAETFAEMSSWISSTVVCAAVYVATRVRIDINELKDLIEKL